jgi:dihydrofolate reductase
MTRTVYYTATSLDGFIADERHSLDWLLSRHSDEHGPMGYAEFEKRVGALAMGATTYTWVQEHDPGAWAYTVPAWVFTHRQLTAYPDADIRFTAADVGEVHAQMVAAAGDRDVWIVGGGDLAGQFADRGLLDEVVVSIAPVTLGAGRPLFTRPFDLKLVDLARNGAFLCARYEVVSAR